MPARKQAARATTALVAIAAALALSACATAPSQEELAIISEAEGGGILPASRAQRDEADRKDLLSQASFWGAEYEKNPNDPETVLKFARVLRGIGSSQRAVEIASPVLSMKPDNVELAMVYAQASLDIGQPQAAALALATAEGAGQGDWRMMSIIGVTMDQLGEHKSAQDYYLRGLTLSPGNPRIMSNLGLSYALAGDPSRAEETLRQAASLDGADARVKQNLSLVLGLQGKFAEAESAVGMEAPRAMVEANAAYFRTLLTPARNWDNLRGSSE